MERVKEWSTMSQCKYFDWNRFHFIYLSISFVRVFAIELRVYANQWMYYYLLVNINQYNSHSNDNTLDSDAVVLCVVYIYEFKCLFFSTSLFLVWGHTNSRRSTTMWESRWKMKMDDDYSILLPVSVFTKRMTIRRWKSHINDDANWISFEKFWKTAKWKSNFFFGVSPIEMCEFLFDLKFRRSVSVLSSFETTLSVAER